MSAASLTVDLSYDDQKNALLDFLRRVGGTQGGLPTEVPGLTISAALPTGTKGEPKKYLTAVRRGGPISNDNYPRAEARFDIFCYASSHYEAQKIAAAAFRRLAPQPPDVVGFTQNGVCVTNVRIEMGMNDTIDQRLQWPAIVFSVVLTINPGVFT